MITFGNKFLQHYPRFANFFKGEIARFTNIEDIGDFSFQGDTPTTISKDDESPFKRPNKRSSYSFNQKSGKALVDEIDTKTWRVEE